MSNGTPKSAKPKKQRCAGPEPDTAPPPFVNRDPKARLRCTKPDGSLFEPEKMDVRDIAQVIELPPPLYTASCLVEGPQGWVVTGNARKIMMMRDEVCMNERGFAIGDATFLRLSQRAKAEISRYELASPEVQEAAKECGARGVHYVFTGSTRNSKDKLGRTQVFAEIRLAKENEKSDGVLREPMYSVRKAFSFINSMHWHRYMFPFGCYFWNDPPSSSEGWRHWRKGLLHPTGQPNYLINPFSVTGSDILYLLNAPGYRKRFLEVISILRWAMKKGVNILYHFPDEECETDASFREFITMERYIHFIGSIRLHYCIAREVYDDPLLGTPAPGLKEFLTELEEVQNNIWTEFSVTHSFPHILDYFTVRTLNTSLSMLTQVFPTARLITARDQAIK